jgi:16S rRNA processing protein RimM
VGEVLRPHGTSGLLRVWTYSGSGDCFSDTGRVFLKSGPDHLDAFSVVSVKPHKNYFLLKLAGIASRDVAAAYRGVEVYVEKEALRRDEDEYYWYELMGLRVYLDSGSYLGRISDIITTGSHDVYLVEGEKGEILIPAIDDVVK